VDVSELKRLTEVDPKALDLAREGIRATAAIDQTTAQWAKNATRAFSSVDPDLTAKTARTLGAFDTTKLVDALGMRKMSEAVAAALPRPLDISPLTAALAGHNMRMGHAALASARPVFNFVKKLEGPGGLAHTQEIAKALSAFDFPRPFATSLADALGHIPRAAVIGLGPTTEAALAEAATLAGSTAVAGAAEEAYAEIDGLTTAHRRDLARDVLTAIPTLLALAAVLTRDRRLELASVLLALAAILISIYWRLDSPRQE
jgi:hypothetical protein